MPDYGLDRCDGHHETVDFRDSEKSVHAKDPSNQKRSRCAAIVPSYGHYVACAAQGEGGFKMKLPRRHFLHLAAGAAALPAMSPFAWAQAYPIRPVRIIVPYPPGGAPDIVARA